VKCGLQYDGQKTKVGFENQWRVGDIGGSGERCKNQREGQMRKCRLSACQACTYQQGANCLSSISNERLVGSNVDPQVATQFSGALADHFGVFADDLIGVLKIQPGLLLKLIG